MCACEEREIQHNYTVLEKYLYNFVVQVYEVFARGRKQLDTSRN